jgi:PII-like signaling protein
VLQAQLQLSVVVQDGDMFAGRALYHEIIDRARTAGLHGATAVRGLQGFGEAAGQEPPGLGARNGRHPVLIEVADDPGRVRAFLPVLHQLIGTGVVMLHAVEAVRPARDVTDITASAAT